MVILGHKQDLSLSDCGIIAGTREMEYSISEVATTPGSFGATVVKVYQEYVDSGQMSVVFENCRYSQVLLKQIAAD